MKLRLALLQLSFVALLLPFGKAAILTESGQPSCDIEELNIGIHRNIWDPTSYWVCKELDEPAEAKSCPFQTGFMNNVKKCVDWSDWSWEDPDLKPNNDEY